MIGRCSACKRLVALLLIAFLIERDDVLFARATQINKLKLTLDNMHNNNNVLAKQHYAHDKVTANLRTILPANLAKDAAAVGETLPQLSDALSVTRGNGPRSRSAKQVHGFESELQQAPVPSNRQQSDNTATQTDATTAAAAAAAAAAAGGKGQVCLTPGCVRAAADIIKNMDQRVDPCDDFYKYSCGSWIESQVIPDDKTSVSLFSVVQDELDSKLRNLIERPAQSDEPPIVNRMRNLYESCMNTSEYTVHTGERSTLLCS